MRRLSVLMLGVALAGCVQAGQDYSGSPSQVFHDPAATGKFVSGREGPFNAEPVPGTWWRLFQSPQLDALVAEALAANADIRVAAANIDRTQALLMEVASARQVQTSIAGGSSLTRTYGTGEALPGHAGYDAGLTVSYEVDVVGRLRRLTEAAEADVGAAQAAYDLARITVVANVVRAYADVCNAGYQKLAAQRSLELQQHGLALTEKLVRGGRGTALDLSRSRAQVEQLRAPIPLFEASRQNALFRLAVLAGRPPADFPTEVSRCAEPPRIQSPIPIGDGASLIRRRPDIRQAERNVAASVARVGVAVADLYPRVQFGALMGATGALAELGSTKAFRFNLGPLVSWTFPNRSLANARIAGAEASERAAMARFDGTVLLALGEVEAALTSYARELERNAALRSARDQATKAVEHAERLQQAGRIGALEILDAQRSLAQAEATLAASDATLATDQVVLFKALGGGW